MFSLFGKKSSKSKTRSPALMPDSLLRDSGPDSNGDSLFNTRAPASFMANDTMEEVRRRQAEMSAKIDAIESEMAGEFPSVMHNSNFRAPTRVPKGVDVPAAAKREPEAPSTIIRNHLRDSDNESPPTLPPLEMSTNIMMGDESDDIDAMEVGEIDNSLPPVIEEAAIFYANGQIEECARALKDAITQEPLFRDGWLLLFELYQQTGNMRAFETMAVDYSVKFESSPPAWREMGAKTKAASTLKPTADGNAIAFPAAITAAVVKQVEVAKRQLKQTSRAQIALEAITEIDAAGAELMIELFSSLAASHEIALFGAEQAVHTLRAKLEMGDRSQPEPVWLFGLELYRILGWQRQYEDLSVDYSVTFEVSPPQYEKFIANVGASAAKPAEPMAETSVDQHLALVGEALGKAAEAMSVLNTASINADRVSIDCSRLTRVDFAAAGTLLNWLISAQGRGKQFAFVEMNYLTAALFNVMGIDGVADVTRRKI